ncbi:MAG TPA: hypothetical protein VF605_08010 [Allosphingosinicella sp.]|jgi:hypothetical protein
MQKTEDRPIELIELGSVTTDTQGAGGPVVEGFIFMPRTGISAD